MKRPFQLSVSIPSTPSRPDSSHGLLVIACGPKLLSFCLKNQVIVAEWPEIDQSSQQEVNDGEPPAKRQKSEETPTIGVKNGAAAKLAAKLPNVIRLTASPDGRHVVAVTDDKSIRVLAIQSDGSLRESSQRCMPKRPCAIEVLPDSSTILCADKFGDVYSLPLVMEDISETAAAAVSTVTPKEDVHYKPAATVLTVHSGRNRQTLENQLRQKNLTPKKDTAKFAHQLQLGHVSMLTDMKLGTVNVQGQQRLHIITADRDEHIRLTRAPPQAHIIEGYCLGHTEFISKLCIVPNTDLLLSGGGDDWIGVWDWPATKLLQKLDLRAPLKTLVQLDERYSKPDFLIAVSGIWTAPYGPEEADRAIIIALEKVPALFITAVPRGSRNDQKQQGISHSSSNADDVPALAVVQCQGNPLDVFQVNGTTAVSIDCRRSEHNRLQILELSSSNPAQDQRGNMPLQGQAVEPEDRVLGELLRYDAPLSADADAGELDKLLYGVSDLRKRSGADPDADAVDAPADE